MNSALHDHRRGRGAVAERGEAQELSATATDPEGAAVLRSRALSKGAAVGRYVVLHLLGEGAMGQVYAGFDVQLDRKVALKVIRPEAFSTRVRQRMLREAQALAKLSHPNVVQVYEVGEHDGQLFVAMEFIDGANLRAWLEEDARSWRETLEVVAAAGRGLAAAHAIGLIHRDVKPDNILVGHDGRARIADFGLVRAVDGQGDDADRDLRTSPELAGSPAARSSSGQAWAEVELTQAGRAIGTPAYMSPEQHVGGDVDARTDQFSLCVTLYEALYAVRPFTGRDRETIRAQALRGSVRPPPSESRVPRWIERALLRGLSPAPGERWPSLEALLAALERDPSRRLRIAGAGALALALVAAASYSLAASQAADADRCSSAAGELATIWDEPRREAMRGALAASGGLLAEPTIPRVERLLDDYADGWVDLHTRTCEAHQRGALSPVLLDLSMSCLGRRKAELAALVDVLSEAAPGTLENAVLAASQLPRVGTCADADALLAATPPPEDAASARAVEALRGELGRALALEGAGRYDDSLALLADLEPRVEALAYPPLSAEHGLRRGSTLMWATHFTEADGVLQRAYADAIANRQDAIAGELLAMRIFVVGDGLERPEEARVWYPEAMAWASRLDDDPELRALILLNTGTIHYRSGRLSEAIAMTAEARDLWIETRGENHFQVGVALNNLSDYYWRLGRCDEGLAALVAAETLLVAALGEAHPLVVNLRGSRCGIEACTGAFASALDCFDSFEGAALWGSWLPEFDLERVATLRSAGRPAQAVAVARRSLQRSADAHPPVRAATHASLAELALADGDVDAARAELREATALLDAAGAPVEEALTTWACVAALDLDAGDVDGARARAEALVARGDLRFPEQPWLVAPARVVLAKAIAASGDLEAARALGELADAELAASGHLQDFRRAELRAWLAGL